jgi:hypothetical protein
MNTNKAYKWIIVKDKLVIRNKDKEKGINHYSKKNLHIKTVK